MRLDFLSFGSLLICIDSLNTDAFSNEMITRRRLLTGAVTAGFGLGAAAIARAQTSRETYPAKPIKLILPYTAGSPVDVIARLIAPGLAARLGQSIVVDNRPGGGTTIGLKAVMASDPDGYTLLFTNTPTHAIGHLVAKGFSYDPIKDFAPIVTVGSTSMTLVVPASLPVNSLRDFIVYAKANPGKINVGFGHGTLPHLFADAFKQATATDITNVPYRGGAQAITDMLGGRIHMNTGARATLLPFIRDGRIKALAITGARRDAELPNVPTMIESGLPDLTTVTYYGFLGPAGTPADVVARINREINESLRLAEVRASMQRIGCEPTGGSPGDFAELIAQQSQRWAPIVRSTGFQMD